MVSSIQAVQKTEQLQQTSTETQSAEDIQTTEGQSDFDILLKSMLPSGQAGEVSEEELFAAMIGERISSLKGEEAATQYKEALEAEKSSLKKGDGYIPFEQAAINALKKMVSGGAVSSEEGDKIYSESFRAAQLDSNTGALFDNRGGKGDPTIAIAQMETALLSARDLVDKIADGTEALSIMSLDGASATGSKSGGAVTAQTGGQLTTAALPGVSNNFDPQGTVFDGAEGFLFKPVTNNEGKLAVLLGAELTGHILSVNLKGPAGEVIEEGRSQTEGIAETGREKWVFNRPGGDYQRDIAVEVRLSDGTVQVYHIPDPSQRYD